MNSESGSDTNTPVRRTARERKVNSKYVNDDIDEGYRKLVGRITASDSKRTREESMQCKEESNRSSSRTVSISEECDEESYLDKESSHRIDKTGKSAESSNILHIVKIKANERIPKIVLNDLQSSDINKSNETISPVPSSRIVKYRSSTDTDSEDGHKVDPVEKDLMKLHSVGSQSSVVKPKVILSTNPNLASIPGKKIKILSLKPITGMKSPTPPLILDTKQENPDGASAKFTTSFFSDGEDDMPLTNFVKKSEQSLENFKLMKKPGESLVAKILKNDEILKEKKKKKKKLTVAKAKVNKSATLLSTKVPKNKSAKTKLKKMNLPKKQESSIAKSNDEDQDNVPLTLWLKKEGDDCDAIEDQDELPLDKLFCSSSSSSHVEENDFKGKKKPLKKIFTNVESSHSKGKPKNVKTSESEATLLNKNVKKKTRYIKIQENGQEYVLEQSFVSNKESVNLDNENGSEATMKKSKKILKKSINKKRTKNSSGKKETSFSKHLKQLQSQTKLEKTDEKSSPIGELKDSLVPGSRLISLSSLVLEIPLEDSKVKKGKEKIIEIHSKEASKSKSKSSDNLQKSGHMEALKNFTDSKNPLKIKVRRHSKNLTDQEFQSSVMQTPIEIELKPRNKTGEKSKASFEFIASKDEPSSPKEREFHDVKLNRKSIVSQIMKDNIEKKVDCKYEVNNYSVETKSTPETSNKPSALNKKLSDNSDSSLNLALSPDEFEDSILIADLKNQTCDNNVNESESSNKSFELHSPGSTKSLEKTKTSKNNNVDNDGKMNEKFKTCKSNEMIQISSTKNNQDSKSFNKTNDDRAFSKNFEDNSKAHSVKCSGVSKSKSNEHEKASTKSIEGIKISSNKNNGTSKTSQKSSEGIRPISQSLQEFKDPEVKNIDGVKSSSKIYENSKFPSSQQIQKTSKDNESFKNFKNHQEAKVSPIKCLEFSKNLSKSPDISKNSSRNLEEAKLSTNKCHKSMKTDSKNSENIKISDSKSPNFKSSQNKMIETKHTSGKSSDRKTLNDSKTSSPNPKYSAEYVKEKSSEEEVDIKQKVGETPNSSPGSGITDKPKPRLIDMDSIFSLCMEVPERRRSSSSKKKAKELAQKKRFDDVGKEKDVPPKELESKRKSIMGTSDFIKVLAHKQKEKEITNLGSKDKLKDDRTKRTDTSSRENADGKPKQSLDSKIEGGKLLDCIKVHENKEKNKDYKEKDHKTHKKGKHRRSSSEDKHSHSSHKTNDSSYKKHKDSKEKDNYKRHETLLRDKYKRTDTQSDLQEKRYSISGKSGENAPIWNSDGSQGKLINISKESTEKSSDFDQKGLKIYPLNVPVPEINFTSETQEMPSHKLTERITDKSVTGIKSKIKPIVKSELKESKMNKTKEEKSAEIALVSKKMDVNSQKKKSDPEIHNKPNLQLNNLNESPKFEDTEAECILQLPISEEIALLKETSTSEASKIDNSKLIHVGSPKIGFGRFLQHSKLNEESKVKNELISVTQYGYFTKKNNEGSLLISENTKVSEADVDSSTADVSSNKSNELHTLFDSSSPKCSPKKFMTKIYKDNLDYVCSLEDKSKSLEKEKLSVESTLIPCIDKGINDSIRKLQEGKDKEEEDKNKDFEENLNETEDKNKISSVVVQKGRKFHDGEIEESDILPKKRCKLDSFTHESSETVSQANKIKVEFTDTVTKMEEEPMNNIENKDLCHFSSNYSSNSILSEIPMPDEEEVKPEKNHFSFIEDSESKQLQEDNTDKENKISIPNLVDKELTPEDKHELEQKNSEIVAQRMRSFELLTENLYLLEHKKCKRTKEMRRMVCDCSLTKEEMANGELGCGEDCLNRLLMIECGSRCALKDNCMNKQFQQKKYSKVEVFNAEDKGCGIRTCENITAGTFIMEYIGEVFDVREFKRRRKEYAKESSAHFYFMALRSDCLIDATRKGNISRFINHSCDPNCETQKWTVNGDIRIGFFATKNVEAGEEINFDYRLERYGREPQKCFCGTQFCRGWLGEAPDEKTKEEKEEDKKKGLRDKKKKEEKRFYFEDIDLEDEIEKLNFRGLRNRQDTLDLSRLMVRAEDSESRMSLLSILKGAESACRRLFLDYHGLKLLWSWMVDVGSFLKSATLKLEILRTLECLPITNKTQLIDSRVLSIVERWSKEIITFPDAKQERAVKKASDTSEESDTETIEVSETPSPEENSLDANDLLSGEKSKSCLHSVSGAIAHLKSPDENKDDDGGLSSDDKEVILLAEKLLPIWKNLKEAFKIPKKERIELMKEHERQVDQGYREYLTREKGSEKDKYEGWGSSKDRRNDRRKQRKEWRLSKSESDDKGLSKEERREKFAQQVAKEDKERQKKLQEEMWALHLQRCSLLGHDPYLTPIFDPTGQFYWDPDTGQWQPYTGPDAKMPVLASYGFSMGLPVLGENNDQPFFQEQMFTMGAFCPLPYLPLQNSNAPLPLSDTERGNVLDPASIPLPGEAPLPPSSDPVHIPLPDEAATVPRTETPPLPPPGSVTITLPPKWKIARNKDSYIYFYHTKTRIAQWSVPQPDQHKILMTQFGLVSDSESDGDSESSSSTSSDSEEFSSEEEEVEEEESEVTVVQTSDGSTEKMIRRIKGKRRRSERLVQERVISPILFEDREVARRERREAKERAREEARSERWKIYKDIKDRTKSSSVYSMGDDYGDSPLDDADDDLGELKGKHSKRPKMNIGGLRTQHKGKSKARMATAMADNSDVARKRKDHFRAKIAMYIVSVLNPYRKMDCKAGRIETTDDFKYLARKLTHFVLVKELKQVPSIEDLEYSDSVKHKTKEFVRKYMGKYGTVFKRDPNDTKEY